MTLSSIYKKTTIGCFKSKDKIIFDQRKVGGNLQCKFMMKFSLYRIQFRPRSLLKNGQIKMLHNLFHTKL